MFVGLKVLCGKITLTIGGKKRELVTRLTDIGITDDDLSKDDLKDILGKLDLEVSGNKPELIAHILSNGGGGEGGGAGGSSYPTASVPSLTDNCLIN